MINECGECHRHFNFVTKRRKVPTNHIRRIDECNNRRTQKLSIHFKWLVNIGTVCGTWNILYEGFLNPKLILYISNEVSIEWVLPGYN